MNAEKKTYQQKYRTLNSLATTANIARYFDISRNSVLRLCDDCNLSKYAEKQAVNPNLHLNGKDYMDAFNRQAARYNSSPRLHDVVLIFMAFLPDFTNSKEELSNIKTGVPCWIQRAHAGSVWKVSRATLDRHSNDFEHLGPNELRVVRLGGLRLFRRDELDERYERRDGILMASATEFTA
ncbi:hypothetical protein OZX72_08540 [Bifidobacterium sp. ESL0769]|uniref:hypothetical protein n=1 Tax=Bifidobacterium sp. ESL0769 TaxID=2983229 RepID=UPI0023F7DF89|nr:hypothetical protein [Bifidobacterium sp. ESL0769]WEV67268.1 hypothetical protein OZX72_08540 [Bifidobacterium sp. ESL0769]